MAVPTYDWLIVTPKATTNWVSNADFSLSASAATPWTLQTGATLSTTRTWHGVRCLKYYGTINGTIAAQALTIKNGQDSVTVSAYVWLVSGGNTVAIGLLIHMMQYIPTTALGLVVLAKSGLSLKTIRQSEEGVG